jgi:hypothetical protein
VKVKIYAEGGGEGELYDTLFRRGWAKFFERAGLTSRLPSVVRGQSRERAYDLFKTAAQRADPDELPILLVDSEDPVSPEHTTWQHLRATDTWARPTGVADDQVFLMVQVMETWFVADRETLRQYFGPAFKMQALPAWQDLEAVGKERIYQALDSATRDCRARRYAKQRQPTAKISFDLLAALDPAAVEQKCPHAHALPEKLRSL